MSRYFYLSILLFIGSFFLPVYDKIPGQLTAKGYECAYELAFNFKNTVAIGDQLVLLIPQYIILNIANPLIIIFIIGCLTNRVNPRLRWLLSNLAMLSAVAFMPYFFMTMFNEFSYGYFSWLAAIIMMNYFGNNQSFHRPKKQL